MISDHLKSMDTTYLGVSVGVDTDVLGEARY